MKEVTAGLRITKILKRVPRIAQKRSPRLKSSTDITVPSTSSGRQQARYWWQVAHRQIDLASVKSAIVPKKQNQSPEPWNRPPRPWTRLIALAEPDTEVEETEPLDFDLEEHEEPSKENNSTDDSNESSSDLERLEAAMDRKLRRRRRQINPRMWKKMAERKARQRKKAMLNARNVTEPDWNALIHVDDLTRIYWQSYLRVLAMRKKCHLILMITKPGQIYIEGKERGVRQIVRHVAVRYPHIIPKAYVLMIISPGTSRDLGA
jgi:hypothetical protein